MIVVCAFLRLRRGCADGASSPVFFVTILEGGGIDNLPVLPTKTAWRQ